MSKEGPWGGGGWGWWLQIPLPALSSQHETLVGGCQEGIQRDGMGEERWTDTAVTGEPGPWRSEDKSEVFVCISFSSQPLWPQYAMLRCSWQYYYSCLGSRVVLGNLSNLQVPGAVRCPAQSSGKWHSMRWWAAWCSEVARDAPWMLSGHQWWKLHLMGTPPASSTPANHWSSRYSSTVRPPWFVCQVQLCGFHHSCWLPALISTDGKTARLVACLFAINGEHTAPPQPGS